VKEEPVRRFLPFLKRGGEGKNRKTSSSVKGEKLTKGRFGERNNKIKKKGVTS